MTIQTQCFLIIILLKGTFAASTVSQTPSCTQSLTPSALPTVLSATRFNIDYFNLTFSLLSDNDVVSVGALNKFGDNIGTIQSTAVLCKTPNNAAGLPYRVSRVDILLFVKTVQANRAGITDFALLLFDDDDSPSHGPGSLVR